MAGFKWRFPLPVWIAVVLIGAILIRLAVPMDGANGRTSQDDPLVTFENVVFQIRDDGSIAVQRTADGPPVLVIVPEECGFLRGILQTQVRPRIRAKIAPNAPYRLNLTESGRLIMTDPGTPMKLEAAAFGSTNSKQLHDIFTALQKADGATGDPAGK